MKIPAESEKWVKHTKRQVSEFSRERDILTGTGKYYVSFKCYN